MTTKFTPRCYQQWGLDRIIADLTSASPEGGLLVYPTGTGKSPFPAWTFEWALKEVSPHLRCLMLVDTKELVAQNLEKMKDIWPECPVGVVSAGLGKRETSANVVFAGIKTAINALMHQPPFNIIFIDEAHAVPASEKADYKMFLDNQKQRNPHVVIYGMTATNWLGRHGPIQEVNEKYFKKLLIDASTIDAFNWFVDEGYLVDIKTYSTKTQFDLTNVKTAGDDYNMTQAEQVMNNDPDTRAAIQESITRIGHLSTWLVFCAGVDHVKRTTAILNNMGVSARGIYSGMSKEERDTNIREFKQGRYTALVNNGILTKGFDFPGLAAIVNLRPCKSPPLWGQIMGRLTRPFFAEGFDLTTKEGRLGAIAASPKPFGVLLDFTNNLETCGPINDLQYRRKGQGGGLPVVKTCQGCGEKVASSTRICRDCGYEFPPPMLNINEQASNAVARRESLDSGPDMRCERVVFVTYTIHRKKDRPDGVKISYTCANETYHEWLNFDPLSKLRGLSIKRWHEIAEDISGELPTDSKDAIRRLETMRVPHSIIVWHNHLSGYPKITEFRYVPEAPEQEALA